MRKRGRLIAVAIAGATALHHFGQVNLADAIYRRGASLLPFVIVLDQKHLASRFNTEASAGVSPRSIWQRQCDA